MKIKVAATQMSCSWEIEENISKAKILIDQAAKRGAKRPGGVPMFLAKGVLGGDLIKLLTTPMKISNEKISKIYNFKYPSYKEGINSILDS